MYQINIYMGLYITRKETDRECQYKAMYVGVCQTELGNFGQNCRSMMKHKRTKRGKITKVIILEMQVSGESLRSANMVLNLSS